jgi:hypothetical protein
VQLRAMLASTGNRVSEVHGSQEVSKLTQETLTGTRVSDSSKNSCVGVHSSEESG